MTRKGTKNEDNDVETMTTTVTTTTTINEERTGNNCPQMTVDEKKWRKMVEKLANGLFGRRINGNGIGQ